MGELVNLPTRKPDGIMRQVFESDGNIEAIGPPMNMDECEGIIHVFAEVPGRCQCGSEVWNAMGDSTATIGIHAVE